eukprot:TRINITY_DN14691_c0_g1_i1.p1 TRINITY_DN14691_c0_g1~~TRINITY_DN14691_c0_g1_i1.p1  ORF type:complete len:108 (-),score=26.93 TRINITY_DN14691_c0_g1_i1:64-387(-)
MMINEGSDDNGAAKSFIDGDIGNALFGLARFSLGFHSSPHSVETQAIFQERYSVYNFWDTTQARSPSVVNSAQQAWVIGGQSTVQQARSCRHRDGTIRPLESGSKAK